MSLGISEYGPQEEIIWGSCLLEMQVRREQNLEGEKVLEAGFLKCIICLGPSLGEILGPPGMTTLKPNTFIVNCRRIPQTPLQKLLPLSIKF